MSQLTQQLQASLRTDDKNSVFDGNRWFSNEEIKRDKTRLMGVFVANGIKPGDRIVLGYPNSYAFLSTYLACLEYGAVILPVNPKVPVPELHRFLVRSKAVAAFFTDEQWAGLQSELILTDLTKVHQLPKTVFTVQSTVQPVPADTYALRGETWHRQPTLRSERPAANNQGRAEVSDSAVAVILYTSGTTGKPKAVGLQHRHLLATAESVISSHRLTPEDTTFCFLPLFHINAQVVAFLSTILSKGRIVVGEKFSATRFWPTIERHGVTWVSAVPTIIAMLVNKGAPNEIPKSLRFVRSASAQLPELHARRFEGEFGIPVIQSYGMTEAASQICVNPLPPRERRLGSVGVPTGVNLMIADESGNALMPRQVGEIAICGDGVIDYYEEAESQKDFREGWFFTGDLGYIDEDGYVYITGRKKEMINRAGEKVSPYEVEDVIREDEQVAQVAVIGLPDALYGERVAAYVTTREPVADEETFTDRLLEHCKAAISVYKCPSEIHVVNSIPIGATGKIQRTVLKSQIVKASNYA